MKEMQVKVSFEKDRTTAKYRMKEEMNAKELGLCSLLSINGIYSVLNSYDAMLYREMIEECIMSGEFWEMIPDTVTDHRNGKDIEIRS